MRTNISSHASPEAYERLMMLVKRQTVKDRLALAAAIERETRDALPAKIEGTRLEPAVAVDAEGIGTLQDDYSLRVLATAERHAPKCEVDTIDRVDAVVLAALRNGPMTRAEVRTLPGLAAGTADKALHALHRSGLVQRVGSGKAGDPYRYGMP